MPLRPGTPKEAGLCPERMARVDALCRAWVDDGTHPALGVLVARNGVIALHEAYGVMGPEPDAEPVPLDAVFAMYSVSKVVTAAAFMTLVEDGAVGLTRPVREYIPEFTGAGKDAVCVHHLLTHTSGLRDEDSWTLALSRWDDTPPPETNGTDHPDALKAFNLGLDTPLYRPPGEEMFYCTFNYALVGEIIRRVTGKSTAEFARKKVFEPLGMRDSSYGPTDRLHPRRVRRSTHGMPFVPRMLSGTMRDRVPGSPDGGLISTTSDMASFVQSFLDTLHGVGDPILRRETVVEMTRNQIPGVRANIMNEQHDEGSWGYGWGIFCHEKWNRFPVFPPGTFGHMGLGEVFVWGDPKHDLVGVFAPIVVSWRDDESPVNNVDLFGNAVSAAVE